MNMKSMRIYRGIPPLQNQRDLRDATHCSKHRGWALGDEVHLLFNFILRENLPTKYFYYDGIFSFTK